jgi:hypothetical protein
MSAAVSPSEPSGLNVTDYENNDFLSQTNACDKHYMTGSESFMVGLAPTFWTHVPLLIHDVQCNMHLLKGVNCLLLNSVDETAISSDVPGPRKIVPISKCTLVGTIVSVERKSNGCIMYVLDDGSGLIDVVHYIEDDFLSVPLLIGLPEGSTERKAVFAPAHQVRVFGRIQCVSIVKSAVYEHQDKSQWISVESAVNSTNVNVQSTSLIRPGKSAVREIHASLILSIDTKSNIHGRPGLSSFEMENYHWMDCARYRQQFGVDGMLKQSILPTLPMLSNALDMLQVLGPDLSSQLRDEIRHGVKEKDDNSWLVFGRNCQCSNVFLKRELLYCRCIATPDKNLDPEFTYRDALLVKLLQMESDFIRSATLCRKLVPDDVLKKISFDEACSHFRFQYNEIAMNEELNLIAFDVLQKAGILKAITYDGVSNDVDRESIEPFAQVRRLIRNTFRLLWRDGILYLVDADADLYLLISRSGVLEPHVKTRMALQKLSAETRTRYYAETSRPRYLDHVSRARLQFIRRSLSAS